jgi:hypothetical protein
MPRATSYLVTPTTPQRKSTTYDAWQAASLLVGLYGPKAVDYANGRRERVRRNGDLAAARTWDLIVSQVEHLLHGAPSY